MLSLDDESYAFEMRQRRKPHECNFNDCELVSDAIKCWAMFGGRENLIEDTMRCAGCGGLIRGLSDDFWRPRERAR